jgi:hypothetical protein
MGERDSLTTGLILLLIIVPLALVGFVLFGPNLTKHLGQAAIGGVGHIEAEHLLFVRKPNSRLSKNLALDQA